MLTILTLKAWWVEFIHLSSFNKTTASDAEATFLDLRLSISNGFFSSKCMISAMFIVNFPFFLSFFFFFFFFFDGQVSFLNLRDLLECLVM